MKEIRLAKSLESLSILKEWNQKFEEKLLYDVNKIRIDTSFGYTNILETGPDKEIPVIILHGAMSGAAFALGELCDLPVNRKIYAVNIPGQSTEAEQVRLMFGSGEYAKWMSEILEALKIERACFVGISWGGSVALELIKDAPNLVNSLLLVVPGSIVKTPILKTFFSLGLPMLKYRIFPTIENRDKAFQGILTTTDSLWSPYLSDANKHYNIDFTVPPIIDAKSIEDFRGPVFVIAAGLDIQFPGKKLLERSKKIFPNFKGGHLLVDSKHCPSFRDEDRKKFSLIFNYYLEVLNNERPNKSADNGELYEDIC